MATARLITAGNADLAERAHAAGAERIDIVPTVVDLDADPAVGRPDDRRPVVGWIGTPQTGEAPARPVHAVLGSILAAHGALLRALGAALTPQESDLPEIRPRSAATEAASICDKDVGVMPLRDMSWTRGECGDTLIQDRACGLPVVALPVGVNAEIVEHGVKGFLARTEAGWRTAIETLLKDPDLRARMGAAGRRKLEERYSLQLWGPRVVEMRRRVAG